MSSVQKIALAIVGVAAITTLVLPGRQSPAVIQSIGGAFNNALGTAIKG
jgi:hypothetical protein